MDSQGIRERAAELVKTKKGRAAIVAIIATAAYVLTGIEIGETGLTAIDSLLQFLDTGATESSLPVTASE